VAEPEAAAPDFETEAEAPPGAAVEEARWLEIEATPLEISEETEATTEETSEATDETIG
jgi:hypothetical protein